MKTNICACAIVVLFLGLTSCGKGEQAKSDNALDSLVNDSVPPSGENEYQNDVEPKIELDSIPDSTKRKQ